MYYLCYDAYVMAIIDELSTVGDCIKADTNIVIDEAMNLNCSYR